MKTVQNKKRFLFQLNHPAHYHLFKHTINGLQERGHHILISIKDKDILKDLVKHYQHVQISTGYRKKQIFSILGSVIDRDRKLLKIAAAFKPDVMVGTSPEIGHISPFSKIPAIFFGEDDVNLSATMYLGALTCYPFFKRIVSPLGCNNGIWNGKTVRYSGYQKLAYLHPNRFKPNRKKILIPETKRFFIVRLAHLNAYHDTGHSGITNTIAEEIIDMLQRKGEVLITSERTLPDQFEKYRFKGNYHDIHHYMYYADLYIGDSQSMAVEAAVLGTPGIRFNDFAGKISVLNELENRYKLTTSIKTDKPDLLLETLDDFLSNPDLKKIYAERRKTMLKEKIDATEFFLWFIENYPDSFKIMKENPEYQNRFKKQAN